VNFTIAIPTDSRPATQNSGQDGSLSPFLCDSFILYFMPV